MKGSKGGKIYYQSKVRRDLLSNLSLEVGLRFFLNTDETFSQKKEKELLVCIVFSTEISHDFLTPEVRKEFRGWNFFFDPTENQLCSKSGMLSVKLVYLLIILGQDENLYKPNDSKIVLIDR